MAAAATLNPPFRFSMVEADLYRGGWPKPRNIPFLQRIKIKTVISLTPEPPIFPPEVQVIHFKIDKKALPLTSQKVTQILGLLGDSTLAPVYVHCLDGALTTSLFCMCLRKQLGMYYLYLFKLILIVLMRKSLSKQLKIARWHIHYSSSLISIRKQLDMILYCKRSTSVSSHDEIIIKSTTCVPLHTKQHSYTNH